MDFSSFDLDHSSKASSTQQSHSNNNGTFEHDASDFFDFIDPTHFHSVNNQQNLDSHAISSKDAQITSTNNYSLLSPAHMNPAGYDTPLQNPTNSDYQDDEEFFTPLISPAIPPNYYTNLRSDTNFSPLTSPALRPQNDESTRQQQVYHMNHGFNGMQQVQSSEELQERLAMIERQQQQLRSHMQQSNSSSPGLYSSSPTMTPFSGSSPATTIYGNLLPNNNNSSTTSKHKQTLRHQIAMSSPQFNPTTAHIRSPGIHPSNNQYSSKTTPSSTMNLSTTSMSPATPSLLMKLGNGMHRNNNNNHNSTTSPASSSHDPILDNIMVLPDAMLPPSNEPPKKKTTINTSSTKKRRISYPRSAFTPPALLPSSSSSSYQQRQKDMSSYDKGIAALVSPAALRPLTPLSPGMMVSSNSPRALKPLISPSLQPNGKRLSSIDEQDAATILASKSNYQALREGQAKSLGIDFNTNIQSGMENRRSAHKAAEQKRRDTLKQNFDALRGELLEALVEEERLDGDDGAVDREKKVKQMSKVVLLQHSYEYILRLKSDNRQKDAKMDKMALEIKRLRTQLGMDLVTEEERLAKVEEEKVEKEKRLARLKRLEEMVDT